MQIRTLPIANRIVLARRLVSAALFALIVVIEVLLFRRFVLREIAWSYPAGFDQAVFLERAYTTYDRMERDGWPAGLLDGVGFTGGQTPCPNGALVHLEAAIVFAISSPGRLAALSLNLLHWVALQAVLLLTLRSLSGRWSVAFIGLGLLLAVGTTFQPSGGIADFRFDFIAFCTFAIFICLALRSGMFETPGWSALAGLAAGYTIAVRFLTLAYFPPIYLAAFAIVAMIDGRRRTRRWRNLLVSSLAAAVIVLPVLLHHGRAMTSYYMVHQLSGNERYVRAELIGAAGWRQSLAYYPKSVGAHHVGFVFWIVAAAALLAVHIAASRGNTQPNRRSDTDAFLFLITALLVPLALLTWDVDKTAVVGDILVAPILGLTMLLLLRMVAGMHTPSPLPRLGAPACGSEPALPIIRRHSRLRNGVPGLLPDPPFVRHHAPR